MITSTNAQDSTALCQPDSAFLESGQIIFPTPYVNDTLGDGIPVEACINTPYDLTFQVLAPGVLNVSGFPVSLTSISIDTVLNLPAGITYECTAPECLIVADSFSCIFLSGTPSPDNQVGDYELKIVLTANTSIGPIPLEYPNPALVPGTYILVLNEEGSANGSTTPGFDGQ